MLLELPKGQRAPQFEIGAQVLVDLNPLPEPKTFTHSVVGWVTGRFHQGRTYEVAFGDGCSQILNHRRVILDKAVEA